MAEVVDKYVTAVEEHLGAIGMSVDNVVADINKLNAQILALENSPDKVTQADQDRITASLETLAALKTKAQALDDMTAADEIPPPPPPVEDPPVEASARRR